MHICLSAYTDTILIVINETGGMGSIVFLWFDVVKWRSSIIHSERGYSGIEWKHILDKSAVG